MSATTLQTGRSARLAERLRESGVRAYIISSPVNMGYLTGFTEGGGERFLTLTLRDDGAVRMICPALSENQARRCGIEDVQTWKDGEDPMVHFRQLAADWGLEGTDIAIDDEMPAQYLIPIQRELSARFQQGFPLISHLMRCKEPQEIDRLYKAAQIADEGFEEVRPRIRAGMTEWEVMQMLTRAMQDRGGLVGFCIVATGANGAEPHHYTDQSRIQKGDVVVMDFGCVYEGYYSDITRTVCVGPATEEQRKVYDTVFRAHMAARSAAVVGASGQDVDRAARKVIADAGYGEFFTHRTGHGLGLRIHEHPNMVEGNTDPLQEGNVFSDEPGIYLPGRFGVRIENILHIAGGRAKSFNAEPSPTLIEL